MLTTTFISALEEAGLVPLKSSFIDVTFAGV
jgi:hypothetical protein